MGWETIYLGQKGRRRISDDDKDAEDNVSPSAISYVFLPQLSSTLFGHFFAPLRLWVFSTWRLGGGFFLDHKQAIESCILAASHLVLSTQQPISPSAQQPNSRTAQHHPTPYGRWLILSVWLSGDGGVGGAPHSCVDILFLFEKINLWALLQ